MHQVSIYTLEVKTSHKISEAKRHREQGCLKDKRQWAIKSNHVEENKREGENVHSAGQGYTCK